MFWHPGGHLSTLLTPEEALKHFSWHQRGTLACVFQFLGYTLGADIPIQLSCNDVAHIRILTLRLQVQIRCFHVT